MVRSSRAERGSRGPHPCSVRVGDVDYAPTGIVPKTVYLATSRETVLERPRERCGGRAVDFVLSEELADRYVAHFEPRTAEEGQLSMIAGRAGVNLRRVSASSRESATGQRVGT